MSSAGNRFSGNTKPAVIFVMSIASGRENLFKLMQVGRLREVLIESGRQRPLYVFGQGVAAQSYEIDILERLVCPEGACDSEAVHPGKPDVAQDDLEPVLACFGDG
jgi:hypothetical protein